MLSVNWVFLTFFDVFLTPKVQKSPFFAIFAILGHFLTFPEIFLTLDIKMIKIKRYLVTSN